MLLHVATGMDIGQSHHLKSHDPHTSLVIIVADDVDKGRFILDTIFSQI